MLLSSWLKGEALWETALRPAHYGSYESEAQKQKYYSRVLEVWLSKGNSANIFHEHRDLR
jgi:hypothetical protein